MEGLAGLGIRIWAGMRIGGRFWGGVWEGSGLRGGRVSGGRVETLPYGYWKRGLYEPGSIVPIRRIGFKLDPQISSYP